MGCVTPHKLILIAAAVVVLALIFQLAAMATSGWATKETDKGGYVETRTNIGLWKNNVYDGASCRPDWFNAVRAFAILGVLAIITCLICFLLICLKSEKAKQYNLIAFIADGAAAVFILVEFAVYADKNIWTNDWDFDLGYSFGLSIVAFLLCVVAAILFAVGHSKI